MTTVEHSTTDMRAESLRLILRTWRHQAVVARQQRLALAQAGKEREVVLLRETFGQWRSRYNDLELSPIVCPHWCSPAPWLWLKADVGQAEEVACRREDAIMFDAWDAWKAKSKVCSAHP